LEDERYGNKRDDQQLSCRDGTGLFSCLTVDICTAVVEASDCCVRVGLVQKAETKVKKWHDKQKVELRRMWRTHK
jgi:hypothetical protein